MKVSEIAIGNISVILDGRFCRLNECNIGNLITDAMVHKYASEYRGVGWTDAPIAIIQGGGIRASVAHVNLPTTLTKGELLTVMPFDGNMVKVTINGSNILKMLEHAVASYFPLRAPGQFLQVSGLRVEYDLHNPSGKRVRNVFVRCGKCGLPMYTTLNTSSIYNILMPSFLSMGGDGFSVFVGLPSTALKYDELQSTIDYLRSHKPLYPAVEGRIVIYNPEKVINAASTTRFRLFVAYLCLLRLLV